MAKTDAGDFGYRAVLDALMAALAGLIDSGLVGADEAKRMAIPTVGRTRNEFTTPFAGSGSFAGLTIERAEIFLGEDRIYEEFEQTGDSQAFAARWAAFVRASTFPTLALGLDGGASDARVPEFYRQMEARMAARLAAAPERTTIPLAKIMLVKA